MPNDSITRTDKEFKKMLKEIKAKRFKDELDEKLLSDRRLTLAISRIPNIRDILSKATITNEDEKKIRRQLTKWELRWIKKEQ